MPNNFVNTEMLVDVFLEKSDRIFAALFKSEQFSLKFLIYVFCEIFVIANNQASNFVTTLIPVLSPCSFYSIVLFHEMNNVWEALTVSVLADDFDNLYFSCFCKFVSIATFLGSWSVISLTKSANPFNKEEYLVKFQRFFAVILFGSAPLLP